MWKNKAMSTGICIITEPELDDDKERELSCYLQELARDYDQIAWHVKQDGGEMLAYLHCPESFMPDDLIETLELEEAEIEHMKIVTKDDFHDPADVLKGIEHALTLMPGLDEDAFTMEKKHLIEDLEELKSLLPRAIEYSVKVQLSRG